MTKSDKTMTLRIGPAVAKAVKPKESSLEPPEEWEEAIAAPKDRMKGIVKGPVTTAPLSKESGRNFGLTKAAKAKIKA